MILQMRILLRKVYSSVEIYVKVSKSEHKMYFHSISGKKKY